MMAKFEEVLKINVNDKTEKKGSLTYLSWTWAWAEFKKIYPEAMYKIKEYNGIFCTGNDKIGYMVSTSVTADGLTYDMWLPVMDMRNKSIMQPTSYDVNKSIMRCLTKNLAMFGLGLYIYAGEDLPEDEQKAPREATKAQAVAKVEEFKRLTKSELISVWKVPNVEKAVEYLEKTVGKSLSEFTASETEDARALLEAQKIKREKALKEQAEDAEIPFAITD